MLNYEHTNQLWALQQIYKASTLTPEDALQPTTALHRLSAEHQIHLSPEGTSRHRPSIRPNNEHLQFAAPLTILISYPHSHHRHPTTIMSTRTYFRITLIRSAIGLPYKSTGVLKALGLRKRMATVFHPVTPTVAGQIMKVKELVAVREVERPLTKQEVHMERVPDPGFYVERRAGEVR